MKSIQTLTNEERSSIYTDVRLLLNIISNYKITWFHKTKRDCFNNICKKINKINIQCEEGMLDLLSAGNRILASVTIMGLPIFEDDEQQIWRNKQCTWADLITDWWNSDIAKV